MYVQFFLQYSVKTLKENSDIFTQGLIVIIVAVHDNFTLNTSVLIKEIELQRF